MSDARTPSLLGRKGRSVGLILGCQVLGLAVWFASTAALPSIAEAEHISRARFAAMTSMIQVGFVIGTVMSAALGLADRIDPRRFFRIAALLGALSTVALVLVSPVGPVALGLRLVTGITLAGVYPVGMRMVASWAKNDTGTLIGLLVGALTLGSASPHLVTVSAEVDWRGVYVVAALAAVVAALAIGLSELGPAYARAPRFDLQAVTQAWRSRPIRLANLGYLDHMWELYAMWACIGAFLAASFEASGHTAAAAPLCTFAVIATGGLGAFFGGRLADRFGRTAVTIGAMAASGTCALCLGWMYAAPPVAVMGVALLWGITVIADSAQFSASIVELSPPHAVGTMLTVQTCAGFALTLVTIQSLGVVVDHVGWGPAFSLLAVGPLLGCVAMARLRLDPASRQLAGGRR